MMLEKVRSQAIRNVNDRLRTTLSFGRIHIAGEMRALRSRDFATVLRKVRLYDSFTKVTDPKGEHDFGIVEHNGRKICFTIGAEDDHAESEGAAPDDIHQNPRVMTLKLFRGFDPRPH